MIFSSPALARSTQPALSIGMKVSTERRVSPKKGSTQLAPSPSPAIRKKAFRFEGLPTASFPLPNMQHETVSSSTKRTDTKSTSNTLPSFDMPSFSMPSFSISKPEAEEAKEIKVAFELPPIASLASVASAITLPSFPGKAPSVDDEITEAAVAEKAPALSAAVEAPIDASYLAGEAASAVGSTVATLGALLLSALTTLMQLLLAKIQLAAVKRMRSAQAYLDAQIAAAEAAPAKALATARRMLYVAPFYARAAVELAVEGALDKLAEARVEAQRRIDDAPRYYGGQFNDAKEKALAAPDKLVQEVSATVKAKLDTAQSTANLALSQAKVQASLRN